MLWILNIGVQWHMLPQGYANYKTVQRRLLAQAMMAHALETGPLMTPLQIEQIDLQDDYGGVFLRFNAKAMPSCYGDAGGVLYKSNPNFDLLYSQVLTMIVMGGIPGQVVYDVVSPGAGSGASPPWSLSFAFVWFLER